MYRNDDPLEAIVVSGGIAHDFEQSSAELVTVLAEYGFSSTVTEDVEDIFTSLATATRAPLVVMNMLRFTLDVERYAHLKGRWGLSLSQQARDGLQRFVSNGGGLLALHGAAICFDDWAEWPLLLGARWEWGTSSHPPLSAAKVTVRTDAHPIVAGIEDFEFEDEVYGFMTVEEDVEGLLHSSHSGVEHPLLWARTAGGGRVVYDALGHHADSLRNPSHRLIVGRSALWAAGAL